MSNRYFSIGSHSTVSKIYFHCSQTALTITLVYWNLPFAYAYPSTCVYGPATQTIMIDNNQSNICPKTIATVTVSSLLECFPPPGVPWCYTTADIAISESPLQFLAALFYHYLQFTLSASWLTVTLHTNGTLIAAAGSNLSNLWSGFEHLIMTGTATF